MWSILEQLLCYFYNWTAIVYKNVIIMDNRANIINNRVNIIDNRNNTIIDNR